MRIDPITALGVLGLVGGAIASNLDTNRATLTATTEAIQLNAVATEVATEALKEEVDLANSRYESGLCIRSTIPITHGMAIDRAYAGSVVCDAQGMTAAVAKDGRLTLLARTGNAEIIQGGIQ